MKTTIGSIQNPMMIFVFKNVQVRVHVELLYSLYMEANGPLVCIACKIGT